MRAVGSLGMLAAVMSMSAAVSGCGPASAQQAGGASEQPAQASDASVDPQAASQKIPVRVSLGFLSKPARFGLASTHPAIDEEPADARWALGDPIGAQPGEGALADFRDRPGCLTQSATGDLKVCFRVQGDVDSVALKDDQIWLEGLTTYLNERGYTLKSDPKLQQASKTPDGGYEATFGFQMQADGASVTPGVLRVVLKAGL